MSVAFSPLQREVIRRLGLTLMQRRDAMEAAQSNPIEVAQPMASERSPAPRSETGPVDAALPAWAQRAMRFLDASRLTAESFQGLPPRPADAKRALWQRVRKDSRRAS